MKRVNSELIHLYWDIGGEIVRQQHEQGWGKSVVKVLAKELQKEFPGVQGFSERNIWLMRSFYLEYSQNTIMHPAGAEICHAPLPDILASIGWKKNTVIMERCKDPLEREFYIKMTKCYGWTKDVLINNIENKAFKKYLTNQTNFDETIPEKYRVQAKLAVKDDYNFDFIEMGIEHSEAELETGLINNIRAFLLEMGGDFGFIGNQYHLDVADDDHFVDMLLYHRRLRCLVAIDLKIGDFKPEYAGKMQFYLSALDENMRLPDENSSIGIIICKSKNRTKVEYTLRTSNRPIGVATYSFYETLPEELRSILPSPDRIAEIVRGMKIQDDERE